jgi:ribonuclease VapC
MSGVVVDTSAAMAILRGEAAGEELAARLAEADERLMSTGTLIELGIVLEARIGPAASGIIDRFLRDGGIDLVSVERVHTDRALEGWRRFGRGRHPAALNLGDLFAYALAASRGHPVLCTGRDFTATDVGVVSPTLT